MNRSTLIAFAVVALLAVAVAALLAKSKNLGKGTGPAPRARQPLTDREQSMFFRLQEALPESVVLAQVAFSALLDSRNTGTRNTFAMKVADFVICTKAFTVRAVIELDDSTHRTKANADAARDAMLKAAGYTVLRYKTIPDTQRLRSDVETKDPRTGTSPTVSLE